MKKLLLIILVLVATRAHSQVKPISTWISNDLGGLNFYKNELWYDFNGNKQGTRYYIVKDTLILTDGRIPGDTSSFIKPANLTKFLEIRKGDQSLTLIPLDASAKWLTKGAPYQVTNIKYIKDATIKFTRIHLNAGQCFGTCPVLSIDIDNKGIYYLRGGEYADPFKGYFKGKLTAKQLDTLNYLIQHSQVEKMQGWKQKAQVSDTPPYNLTLYYNSKNLRVATNWPPMNITDLIRFLTSTYKKVALVPDPEKHEFDEGPDLKY
jgi:hypothetical protein